MFLVKSFIHSKLQQLHHWSLGMDKWFDLTLYWAYDYLSILGLKLIHVSTRGIWIKESTKTMDITTTKWNTINKQCLCLIAYALETVSVRCLSSFLLDSAFFTSSFDQLNGTWGWLSSSNAMTRGNYNSNEMRLGTMHDNVGICIYSVKN